MKTPTTSRCARRDCGNTFEAIMVIGKARTQVPCAWRLYCSKPCANRTRAERHWRRKLGLPNDPKTRRPA